MTDRESNPFADPHKQHYSGGQYPARGGREVRTDALEGYNPFEQGQGSAPGGPAVLPEGSGTASQPPPPMSAGSNQPPAYSASAGSWAADKAELERRQRELEAKATEIEKREEAARRMEEEARRGTGTASNKNWPPLPSFCPVGPCFYQDIDVEIPSEFRSLVRVGYYVWLAHAVVMALNVICAFAFFIANVQHGNDTSESGTTFGLSIVFLFLFTPAAYVCWFRPLYKAFRSDSSFNFMVFFFIFLFQCGVVIVQAIGINWFASCGWLNALKTINVSLPAAILMMLAAALFSLLAAVDIILLIKVHRVYRGTGASFQKAKQEFTEGVSTNEVVRGAAADIGAAAARGAVSSRQ